MKIVAVQKVTLIDYPGRVAATVFLAGCNFRCPWCYSKELVLPELYAALPGIPEKDLFAFLEGKRGYLEGVVLCGGEPTVNPELPAFIKKIKDAGFLVKLDTNGSNPGMVEGLIKDKLIDYVAMDIKLPKERYARVFNGLIPVENIQKSIDILKNSSIDFEFRTTVVPGVHTEEDLISMAQWIGGPSVSSGSKGERKPKYFLQNFRAERNIDPAFEQIKPYDDEFFLRVCEKITGCFSVCKTR
jgi:pyruvate formate lyase activating enzyme